MSKSSEVICFPKEANVSSRLTHVYFRPSNSESLRALDQKHK